MPKLTWLEPAPCIPWPGSFSFSIDATHQDFGARDDAICSRVRLKWLSIEGLSLLGRRVTFANAS
jgi:hypothetical protein